MKRFASIALLASILALPALADYDAAAEAKEAAQRKAAQQEAARKKAETEKMKADLMNKQYRLYVGAEANGKSDAEVKALYDKKMAGYMKQGADMAPKAQQAGKVDPSKRAEADAASRSVTGKTMGEMQGMSNAEAQALAREMEKKYGAKQ